MRFRIIICASFCLLALSTTETVVAASPRTEAQTQSPSALRRAERLRLRLLRRAAVERRLQERLDARSGTRRQPTASSSNPLTDRVLVLVNDARKDEGLPPLATHPALEKTAQAHAEDMAARGYFSHDDLEGRSSAERILAGGYEKPTCNCSWVYGTGENLAHGQEAAADAVRDWLASPGHRENILKPEFDDTGIGFFDGYWVQHFGVSNVLP